MPMHTRFAAESRGKEISEVSGISAVCRENEISYSKFINALKKGGIVINRKILSNMAIDDTQGIQALISKAKSLVGAN